MLNNYIMGLVTKTMMEVSEIIKILFCVSVCVLSALYIPSLFAALFSKWPVTPKQHVLEQNDSNWGLRGY